MGQVTTTRTPGWTKKSLIFFKKYQLSPGATWVFLIALWLLYTAQSILCICEHKEFLMGVLRMPSKKVLTPTKNSCLWLKYISPAKYSDWFRNFWRAQMFFFLRIFGRDLLFLGCHSQKPHRKLTFEFWRHSLYLFGANQTYCSVLSVSVYCKPDTNKCFLYLCIANQTHISIFCICVYRNRLTTLCFLNLWMANQTYNFVFLK